MTRGDELPRHLVFCHSGGADGHFGHLGSHYHLSNICPKMYRKHLSYSRHVCREKRPESVLEPRQKQNVGGVFLATSTQTYANWNDLLQHHKNHQSTLSFSLKRFSNGKLPAVISSPRSCRVTRISPIGHMASSTQVFHLVAFLSPTEPGSRRVPDSAQRYRVWTWSMLHPHGGRRSCAALRAFVHRKSCYCPCIFCLMDLSGPQGHILIEVDDLATRGNTLKTWRNSRRPSHSASGRASTTVRVTTPVERSFRISLTVSM